MLETIQYILTILIWPSCIILLLLILVQGGSGDLSSTFGGGGSLDSTLGVGASRKMGKITGWLSVMFLASVLILSIPTGGAITDDSAEAAGNEAAIGPASGTGEGDVIPTPPVDVQTPPVAPVEGAADAPAEGVQTPPVDPAAPTDGDAPAEDGAPVEGDVPAAGDAEAAAPEQPAVGDEPAAPAENAEPVGDAPAAAPVGVEIVVPDAPVEPAE